MFVILMLCILRNLSHGTNLRGDFNILTRWGAPPLIQQTNCPWYRFRSDNVLSYAQTTMPCVAFYVHKCIKITSIIGIKNRICLKQQDQVGIRIAINKIHYC